MLDVFGNLILFIILNNIFKKTEALSQVKINEYIFSLHFKPLKRRLAHAFQSFQMTLPRRIRRSVDAKSSSRPNPTVVRKNQPSAVLRVTRNSRFRNALRHWFTPHSVPMKIAILNFAKL